MMNFPGKREQEKVLMVIRKHPVVYIRLVLTFVLVAIIPVWVMLDVWYKYNAFGFSNLVSKVVVLLGTGYILLSLLLTCIAWLNEEFDLFILTNERLIDITQVSFLNRTVASTPLKQIQDTTSDINGILQTLLNYGSIEVQTAAGDASKFEIDKIPDPATVARNILNYARESRGELYEEAQTIV